MDELIARVKAATVKNRTRKALSDDIGLPPEPVVTRWGSWLSAALYYSSHLPRVREIVNNFEGNGLLVQRLQLKGWWRVWCYEPLSKIILKLEAAGCSIEEASTLVNGLNLG